MFQSQPQSSVEYGKSELVELLTGVKSQDPLGWVSIACESPLKISSIDVPKIHAAVLSFESNRIRNYGENGAYTLYFKPAIQTIKQGFEQHDFEKFRSGCEHLLSLISAD